MATRQRAGHHGETEAAAEGFQASLERGFEWVNANARIVLVALGAFVVLGGLAAGIFEYTRVRGTGALDALATVERAFAQRMGASGGVVLIPEPANAEQAAKAREEALAGFAEVARLHAGSVAAQVAEIRAAELEIDLGRLDAARDRLRALGAGLAQDDPRRGVALRLLGYVLEEQGLPQEAGEAYAEAGRVTTYRARAAVFAEAGESFARAGQLERAIEALGQVIAIDSDYAAQIGIPERRQELEALAGVGAPAARPAPPAP